jgi:CO/xanthine dehydrogenase Mo-binding subunit
MAECLLAVKDTYESAPIAGIASCFKNAGLGVGVPDTGRCIISVEGGRIHVRCGASCIGQGLATVLLQMVCETLAAPPGLVTVEPPDTARTPNSGTTTASRQTTFSGEATVRAARLLKEALDPEKPFAEALSGLEGREFYGEYKPHTDPMGSDKPNPVSHVSYGYAAQVAELDKDGRLIRVTAAYDLGATVNPKAAEGQIEGGIVMGAGYALTEDFPVEGGYPKVKYGTLGLLRATDVPEMSVITVRRSHTPEDELPAYGAKGVGELATIPTAPAIQGAYYRLDGVFRQKLPLENTYYRRSGK